MKRSIIFLLSICVLLFSCSDGDDPVKEIEKPPIENKDPFITLKKSNIDFTNEGGSESILIESNVSWTAKSSASWCTVTPSSGDKSTTSITLSAPANEDYDNRSCTVTIESGNISKTITVNQGEGLGLLITQDRYELGNEESTITVEVKANVEFEVEINDEWITKIEKRGLVTTELEFNIAENDTYGNREGSITIKQKDGDMVSTITIFQSQEDAIILSEKEFDLSSEAQSIEVEVKTNIDYEIIIPEDAKDWVSHASTRALRTETVVLDIAKNEDYDERTVEVVVKDKKTDLEETVTIKQAANTGLIVSEDKYELSNDGGTIEVEVKANVEFDIEIADSWITRVETRGLTETKLQFQVAKNESYDNREGTITIKQKDGNLSSTIKVYQSQKDAIILTDKELELTNEAQSVEVEIKTNIDYEVIIPEEVKSWVAYVETRALRTETVVLEIAENTEYDKRTAEITIKNKETKIEETLTIDQAANSGLIVSEDKYELSNDGGTIEVEVKANVEFDIEIADSWITRVETRGLTTTNLTFEVAKNESYSNREGSITISQTDGALTSTITVYQSQENALILSEKEVEVSDRSQNLEVVIKTNIDFDVTIQEEGEDWVSYTPTRGLREETISLNISANNSDKVRSTEVYIKDKLTSLQETLTITQMGKEPGVYYVDKMGTLGSMLNQTQKDTITTMIVKGEINKADFDVMKLEMPKLKYIDLKEVKCEGDRIPEYAFGDYHGTSNKNISTIILPESITAIGEYAFNDCTGLTGDLILPDGVTEIGSSAFVGCSGFTGNLIIPDGVTEIGYAAFQSCSGFTGNLILPDELKTIGLAAFSDCSGFTGDLIIPNGVTTIEAHAFQNCSGFTGSLMLPSKLSEIEIYTFDGCSGFTGDLVIPNGVITIASVAFNGCYGFTGNLILPDELKTIGSYSFRDCSGFIGDLIIPSKVTTIGQIAFANCSGFTGDLIISNKVTKIEEKTFSRCSGFAGSLILPKGLTIIEKNAFEICSGFRGGLIIPDEVTEIGKDAFYHCYGFTELSMSENIATIYEGAFRNCYNITGNVVFPLSLVSIRKDGFSQCKKVEAFQFPHTTPLTYYTDMLEKSVPVKVPNQAVSTYQSTNGWKDHTIVGY